MTNRELVLEKLREKPVSIADFVAGFRLAPRIHELRKMGYKIKPSRKGKSDGIATYTLESEAVCQPRI